MHPSSHGDGGRNDEGYAVGTEQQSVGAEETQAASGYGHRVGPLDVSMQTPGNETALVVSKKMAAEMHIDDVVMEESVGTSLVCLRMSGGNKEEEEVAVAVEENNGENNGKMEGSRCKMVTEARANGKHEAVRQSVTVKVEGVEDSPADIRVRWDGNVGRKEEEKKGVGAELLVKMNGIVLKQCGLDHNVAERLESAAETQNENCQGQRDEQDH